MLLFGAVAASPADAGAHGELVAQSPSPGENVGSVAHIDLVFSTPISDFSVTVERPSGDLLDGQLVLKAASYLSFEVTPIAEEGQYIVRYSAMDSDGDVVDGAYAFTFTAGAPVPSDLPVDLSVLLVDERWPWWYYGLLFGAVVVIAVLAGLLAEKLRRLRSLQPAS